MRQKTFRGTIAHRRALSGPFLPRDLSIFGEKGVSLCRYILSKQRSMRKFGLCADHAGFALKEEVKRMLDSRDIDYIDYGVSQEERCDYPDYAHQLAQGIERGDVERGIAICGTGNGMAMTLNKYPHIRAGLSWSREIGELVRAHNDANVLVLPARFISVSEAAQILEGYLETPFEGGRHQCRIDKIPLQQD